MFELRSNVHAILLLFSSYIIKQANNNEKYCGKCARLYLMAERQQFGVM